MRSDARLLLNKKKWKKASGSNKNDAWKSRGTVDARKILNLKRSQKSKPPVLGSFMRTKSATALIASQIKKEITAASKVPDKRVQLSSDGNIIITSKPKNISRVVPKKEALPKVNFGTFSKNTTVAESMQYQPSTSIDDLEHTAIEDLIDLESLPPAHIASNSLQNANLSRKSIMNQILDKRYTMVADQFSQYARTTNAKVCVSNLHPSVSRQDVVELFGDIGVIKSVDMIMPGTAVIEFFDEEDALKACNIYHNRKLDGLPMQCYLQSSSSPQRFAISQRLGSRNERNPYLSFPEVSPTVTNSRSRYDPRNVQFTVKLT